MKKIFSRLPQFLKRKPMAALNSSSRESYIIGYPKSGNTWLRVMLGKYVQLLIGRDQNLPMPLFDSFVDLDPRVPLIQVTHGPLEWTNQTAADLTLDNVVFPYRPFRVVLLVRSIPDILVSLFWQEKTRSQPPYWGTISDFIRDPVLGVKKAIAFYRLWYEGRDTPRDLVLMRYEDLRYRTDEEFQKLLEFFHIPVVEKYMTDAVAYSNFDNMRNLELNNMKSGELVYRSSGYSVFGTGDVEKTTEAFHVRKGQVGGFREYLSEADVEYLLQSMKDRVPEWYGYQNGLWKDLPE